MKPGGSTRLAPNIGVYVCVATRNAGWNENHSPHCGGLGEQRQADRLMRSQFLIQLFAVPACSCTQVLFSFVFLLEMLLPRFCRRVDEFTSGFTIIANYGTSLLTTTLNFASWQQELVVQQGQ